LYADTGRTFKVVHAGSGEFPSFKITCFHIFLIHTLAVLTGILFHQPISWLWRSGFILHQVPAGYGHPLAFRLPEVAGGFANTLLPLQMVCGFQEPPSRSLSYL
jgi:hypothetical protein